MAGFFASIASRVGILLPLVAPIVLAQSIDSTQSTHFSHAAEPGDAAYVADVRLHSAEELESLLRRIDRLFTTAQLQSSKPIIFLLHGEEAKTLVKQHYADHRSLVDLAAKLSAFDIVDIKVCERWSDVNQLATDNLQPFVSTVPYAPSEEQRLITQEGYRYF